MSQQCAHAGMKINHVWGCINKTIAGRLMGLLDYPVCEPKSKVLCPVWSSAVQERYWKTGESSKEGCQDDQGAGAPEE